MLNTPVLFLIFNRLDTAQKVFAKIREAKPRQLFIGADGARAGKEGETEKVATVRQYIIDQVDWDCEVKTLFREENLGCGVAPYEAITWFFEHVEQGIILEDDCLPDLTFFSFCETLLEYYKDNKHVMHISGSNFQFGKTFGQASYYASKYAHGWGWATWRRAWQTYEFVLPAMNEETFYSQLEGYQFSIEEKKSWYDLCQTVKNMDAWDYQWQVAIWKHKGICLTPNQNLITNVGFDDDATHTKDKTSKVAYVPISPIHTLIHASSFPIEIEADKILFRQNYFPKEQVSLINLLRGIGYRYFPALWNTLKNIKNKLEKR